MLPSHQGLESGEQSCMQGHDGLVMKPQLFPFNGAAQIGFDFEQSDGLLVHGFVKHLMPAFARHFGSIHGRVGIAQKLLGAVVARGTEGDPDAGRREHLAPVQVKGQQELFSNPLDRPGYIAGMMDIVHQNSEFVSPQARHRIRIAQRSLKPSSNFHQQLITQSVPHAVVDHLKAVEVHIEDGKQIVWMAFGAGHAQSQPVEE